MLPPSLIQLGPDLSQPTIHQASIGYERPLKTFGQFRTDYMMTRATDTFRSINVNAPLIGVRPDPTAGNITQIESTGRRDSDRITAAVNLRVPNRRIMGNVMYQWTNNRGYADSPLMLPANSNFPDADWGPPVMDIRHRAVPDVQYAGRTRHPRRAAGAVLVGAALQHHHRARRQRRHRRSTIGRWA